MHGTLPLNGEKSYNPAPHLDPPPQTWRLWPLAPYLSLQEGKGKMAKISLKKLLAFKILKKNFPSEMHFAPSMSPQFFFLMPPLDVHTSVQ